MWWCASSQIYLPTIKSDAHVHIQMHQRLMPLLLHCWMSLKTTAANLLRQFVLESFVRGKIKSWLLSLHTLIDLLYFLSGCWAPSVFHRRLWPKDRTRQEETGWDSGRDQRWSGCKGDWRSVGISGHSRSEEASQRTLSSLFCFYFSSLSGRACSRVEWRNWEAFGPGRAARRWGERGWGTTVAGKSGKNPCAEEGGRG